MVWYGMVVSRYFIKEIEKKKKKIEKRVQLVISLFSPLCNLVVLFLFLFCPRARACVCERVQ